MIYYMTRKRGALGIASAIIEAESVDDLPEDQEPIAAYLTEKEARDHARADIVFCKVQDYGRVR